MQQRKSTFGWVIATVALVGGCAAPGAAAGGRNAEAAAREQARPAPGAVLLVRTPKHLRAAIRTAHEGLAGGSGFARYRIFVCGDAVTAIQKGSALEPELFDAKSAGVAITACGMSLAEQGVRPEALSAAIDVVPNALAEVLRLQSLGWASVEL